MVFNKWVELFHYDQLFHRRGEIQDLLFGQRPDHAQLQDRVAVPKDFLHILVAGGGGDDADGVIRPFLGAVEGRLFGEGDQLARAFLDDGVALDGVARHHNVLGDVLFIGLEGGHHPLPRFHQGLGMGDPGAHLDKDRGVETFGHLVGFLDELKGLGRIGRLQHGQLGRLGIVAGILLVLGGVHARVVRHGDDHAAVHARIGNGKQRVRRHVQADVLHPAEGARPGQARAEGRFHGDLFVGGPLAVNLVKFGCFLGDLRARGARIAGSERASRFVQAPRRGHVSQKKFLHGICLSVLFVRPSAPSKAQDGPLPEKS